MGDLFYTTATMVAFTAMTRGRPGYISDPVIDTARNQIIMHQAVTVDNDPDDRACRTKRCATPVGDMEKLFSQLDWLGWHRVTWLWRPEGAGI